MKRIAITAQQGSGKTFIAMKFASLGVPVLIMDQVVKQLQITNESLIKKIKRRFPGSYTGNVMNKEYMVRKLFYDETGKNLKDISEIIKPYLKEELEKFYEEFSDRKYVLVESALIYEYNMQNEFDEVIFVNADPEKRKQMAMSRDKITSDEYNRRMKTQLPDQFKIDNSKWIVNNDYTEGVFEQVKQINDLIN
jgi:dephospho-CoA kinase